MTNSTYPRILIAFVFALAVICSPKRGNAQSNPKPFLLALSKNDRTLAVVDPVTLTVIGRIPVGEDPHEVAVSADGRTAYVSIYGGGSLHEINVIALGAQKPLLNIDTRPLFGPHGLVFVGGKVWFSAEGSKSVGRYDPATNKLDWSMGTGQDRTHMIWVTADGKQIYTTNVSSGTVSILVDSLMQQRNIPPPGNAPPGNMPPPSNTPPGPRPRREWVQEIVSVGKGSEGFDVSPDNKELWTAASEDGTIAIIDLVSKKVTKTIDAKVLGANRLKFTPDGKLVFITSLRSGDLVIYDAHSRKEVNRIAIGHGAAGIQMDPDRPRVFVACSPDNYIAVIDLRTLKVIGHLDVGGNPDGMAWVK